MLEDLPPEILVAIAAQLTEKGDVKRLCEVSTSLCSLVTPILYESITVEVEEESLEDIYVAPLLQTRYTTRNLLHHVKSIGITSQFHTRTKYRCVHNKIRDALMNEEEDEEESEDEHSSFPRLAKHLRPLLEGCRNDYLRRFTWELGTCVPPEIMGPSGYLPLKQKNIESIRLVTDGACKKPKFQDPIALPTFEHLKRLSWSGLRSEVDFEALHDALQRISNQLVELELDLIDWHLVSADMGVDDSDISEDGWDNFFASNILGLSSGSLKQMFPALQVLSLSAVSFKSAAKEIAHAFNFGSVRSLKLRSCPGWEDFLQHVSQSNQQIGLKSLEIQYTIEHENSSMEDTISDFLRTFEGLEELFLSTTMSAGTVELWRSVLCHKSTLRRIVHHQRTIVTDGSRNFGREHDLPDLSFYPEDMAGLMDASQNPLSELNLECIGFCCIPEFLKCILSPFTINRSLQVLHIRQSGSDLEHFASRGMRRKINVILMDSESDDALVEIDAVGTSRSRQRESRDGRSSDSQLPELTNALHNFVQWAFGPRGFPSLRVIAFGDFSYEGRYRWNNVLLCRNDEPVQSGRQEVANRTFRRLADNDESLWDLLEKYSNVLEACPTNPLFEQ